MSRVLTAFLCVSDVCSALMGLCLTAVITYPGATMLQAAGMKRLIDTIRCQLNDHHSEFEKYYVKRNAGTHHPRIASGNIHASLPWKQQP